MSSTIMLRTECDMNATAHSCVSAPQASEPSINLKHFAIASMTQRSGAREDVSENDASESKRARTTATMPT